MPKIQTQDLNSSSGFASWTKRFSCFHLFSPAAVYSSKPLQIAGRKHLTQHGRQQRDGNCIANDFPKLCIAQQVLVLVVSSNGNPLEPPHFRNFDFPLKPAQPVSTGCTARSCEAWGVFIVVVWGCPTDVQDILLRPGVKPAGFDGLVGAVHILQLSSVQGFEIRLVPHIFVVDEAIQGMHLHLTKGIFTILLSSLGGFH